MQHIISSWTLQARKGMVEREFMVKSEIETNSLLRWICEGFRLRTSALHIPSYLIGCKIIREKNK